MLLRHFSFSSHVRSLCYRIFIAQWRECFGHCLCPQPGRWADSCGVCKCHGDPSPTRGPRWPLGPDWPPWERSVLFKHVQCYCDSIIGRGNWGQGSLLKIKSSDHICKPATARWLDTLIFPCSWGGGRVALDFCQSVTDEARHNFGSSSWLVGKHILNWFEIRDSSLKAIQCDSILPTSWILPVFAGVGIVWCCFDWVPVLTENRYKSPVIINVSPLGGNQINVMVPCILPSWYSHPERWVRMCLRGNQGIISSQPLFPLTHFNSQTLEYKLVFGYHSYLLCDSLSAKKNPKPKTRFTFPVTNFCFPADQQADEKWGRYRGQMCS